MDWSSSPTQQMFLCCWASSRSHKYWATLGILIFVHQQIAQAVLVLGQDFRIGFEDGQHMQQQIAEIRGVQGLQAFLIDLVKRRCFAPRKVTATATRAASVDLDHFVGGQSAVFPVADDGGGQARGPAFFVNPGGAQQLFQQPDLVVAIEDGEVGFQSHCLGMGAQDAGANGNERCRSTGFPRGGSDALRPGPSFPAPPCW